MCQASCTRVNWLQGRWGGWLGLSIVIGSSGLPIVYIYIWATLFGTRVLKSFFLVPRPLQQPTSTSPRRLFLFFLGRRLSMACGRFFSQYFTVFVHMVGFCFLAFLSCGQCFCSYFLGFFIHVAGFFF
jgi:hypothetical protein